MTERPDATRPTEPAEGDPPETSSGGWWRVLALSAGAFGLGVAAALAGLADDEVFLTSSISYRPADSPWWHGLNYLAWLWLIVLTFRYGFLIGLRLLTTRWFVPTVGVVLLLVGLGTGVGAGLGFAGQLPGFDTDQAGGLLIAALVLVPLGGLMTFAVVRDLLKPRREAG